MAELSRAQQAGILCNDETFQNFANFNGVSWTADDGPDEVAEMTAQWVRKYCQVDSRRRLDVEEGGRKWDQLRAEYDAWTGKIGRP